MKDEGCELRDMVEAGYVSTELDEDRVYTLLSLEDRMRQAREDYKRAIEEGQ